MSARDDACFGVGWTSGGLADPRFSLRCVAIAVGDYPLQIMTPRLYLPPKPPPRKPSKWDRASSEAGSLLATRTVTPKEFKSGAMQSFNRWLRTLTSLGNVRLASIVLINTVASVSPGATLASVTSGAR